MRPHHRDQNQAEGARASSRRFSRDVRRFVADGQVEGAAAQARRRITRGPAPAAPGEAEARERAREGREAGSAVSALVARGRAIVDRIQRAVAGRRSR